MFLSNDELKTVLYAENILAVSGGDDTLVTAAIQGAIAEAKSHLSRYDKVALFDTPTGDQRNPLLLIFVKDIAVWHFLNLANPGTSLEFRRSRYNAAIQWLKDVNGGDADADFPLLPVGDNGGGTIFYGSNPKSEKHY